MNEPPRGGGSGRATKAATLSLLAAFALSSASCQGKASQAECDRILDHFAALVVRERMPDAGPDVLASEQARERSEAKRADEFKSCTSEVQKKEYDCAVNARSSDGVIKCLE